MKEINSFELIEVPEGIEASVKARAVTVKGARGTLTKVKRISLLTYSDWTVMAHFLFGFAWENHFSHPFTYIGVQASGS